MLHYVFQDQLAGTTTDPNNLPQGFQVLEGPDLPQDLLYYDLVEGLVKLRPDRPSPMSYWSVDRWAEPEVFTGVEAPTADPDLFESVRRKLWGTILSIQDPTTQLAIALLAQMTLAGYAEQKGRQDLLDEALARINDLVGQDTGA
jgi:hypothetical protein